MIDHIDTRVPSLAKVEPFYDKLMPLLGFPSKKLSYVDENGEWGPPRDGGTYNTAEYFTPGTADEASFFIGFIERADTAPSFTRIAFRVEDVTYPAIFFEDPDGTKLEIVSRRPR